MLYQECFADEFLSDNCSSREDRVSLEDGKVPPSIHDVPYLANVKTEDSKEFDILGELNSEQTC